MGIHKIKSSRNPPLLLIDKLNVMKVLGKLNVNALKIASPQALSETGKFYKYSRKYWYSRPSIADKIKK